MSNCKSSRKIYFLSNNWNCLSLNILELLGSLMVASQRTLLTGKFTSVIQQVCIKKKKECIKTINFDKQFYYFLNYHTFEHCFQGKTYL